jgi:hypothetical protein
VTWLVLCGFGDHAARWAFERLCDLTSSPVELVTDEDLLGAAWDHRVGDDAVVTNLRLTDGRTLRSSEIRGTLNRLTHAPPALAGLLAPTDREYGYAELSALLLSWLAALDGPILNPPATRGLCGAWRPAIEWANLAAEAGIAWVTLEADSVDQPATGVGDPSETWLAAGPGPVREDAIVIGASVFSARRLDGATRDACRRLAALAETPILGLAFDATSAASRPRLLGATPLPDLREGGTPLIAALATALAGPGRISGADR